MTQKKKGRLQWPFPLRGRVTQVSNGALSLVKLYWNKTNSAFFYGSVPQHKNFTCFNMQNGDQKPTFLYLELYMMLQGKNGSLVLK